jgi:hypothetical protein
MTFTTGRRPAPGWNRYGAGSERGGGVRAAQVIRYGSLLSGD